MESDIQTENKQDQVNTHGDGNTSPFILYFPKKYMRKQLSTLICK